MASADLKKFLNKLHMELSSTTSVGKQPSQAYRELTGDRKTTTLTYKGKNIQTALNLLLAKNIEGVNMSGLMISYDKLVLKLTADIKIKFKALKMRLRDRAVYLDLPDGVSITLIEDGESDNYNTIKNEYKKLLDTFYTDFLELIGKEEGLTRMSGNKKDKRTVRTGGEAFNLAHIDGSNIEHMMNDAIYTALDSTYGASTTIPPKVEAELKKVLGADADAILSIVKNGKLGTVKVSISSALLNAQQGGGQEQLLKQALDRVMQRVRMDDLPGSDSLASAHRKKLIKEMVKPFLNKKGIKVKHEDFKIKENKTPEKLNKKATTTRVVRAVGALSAKKQIRRKNRKAAAAPRMGLKNILGVLNAKLPEQIAKNMGSPRLENQTGRFAQSVRAIDVNQTSQGFPSIGYTYARNPYGVYESTSGSRFAEVDRDPRTLIDTSIREIVAQFGLGRLYTRRQ